MSDAIDGGAGTDTLNLTIYDGDGAAAGTAALPAGFETTSVEVVNLKQAADSLAVIDSAAFDGVQQLWQIDGVAGSAVSVGADVTAGFRDVTVAAADAVTGKAGVTSLSAALDSVDNASNVTFAEAAPAGQVKSVSVTGDVDTAAGANTLTVDASGLTAVETATISISSDTTVTYTQANTETSVDLSGSTGDLTLALSNAGFTEEQVDFKGGTGNNTYNVTAAANGADVALNLQLNSGDDVVNVTGGANLTAAVDEGDITGDLITITDFSAADDALDISGLTGLNDRTAQNIVDAAIDGETSLFDAATAAFGAAGGTNGDYVLFDYEGDAYIGVDADGGQDLSAGDALIKVAGVSLTDFDATNFVA